jgi:methionyl aminopeptidase
VNRLLKRPSHASRAPIHNAEAIGGIRAACKVAAQALNELCDLAKPGVTTYDIEQAARRTFAELGAESPCYNYVVGQHTPFPAYICQSLNDEVVHGYGSMRKVLREGDNLTIDVAVRYKGWIGDNARTVAIGAVQEDVRALLEHTEAALYKGIEQAKAGNRVGHISSVIQKFVEGHGYSVVREYCGHGVGRTMHEEPPVPNYGRPREGAKLYPGMVIAIEPMVCMGTHRVVLDADTWTSRTADNRPAAHFEHTVLITDDEPEILTKA